MTCKTEMFLDYNNLTPMTASRKKKGRLFWKK